MRSLLNAMAKNVEVIGPDTSVAEAASRMQELDIGALPVCDNHEVIGMITDRDIVTRLIAEGRDPKRTLAREIMSRDVVFALEDQTLLDAVEKMRERKVGRLIVLNRARRLKGLVTLGDLARQLGKDHMAALISEKITSSRPFARLSANSRRRVYVSVGALAGAAGIIAGLRALRKRGGQAEEDQVAYL